MSLVIGVSIGNHVTGRLTTAAHLCFGWRGSAPPEEKRTILVNLTAIFRMVVNLPNFVSVLRFYGLAAWVLS